MGEMPVLRWRRSTPAARIVPISATRSSGLMFAGSVGSLREFIDALHLRGDARNDLRFASGALPGNKLSGVRHAADPLHLLRTETVYEMVVKDCIIHCWISKFQRLSGINPMPTRERENDSFC